MDKDSQEILKIWWFACKISGLKITTPPKMNIEPENDGLESWKMIFLFQGCILRFQPLIFRVVIWMSLE